MIKKPDIDATEIKRGLFVLRFLTPELIIGLLFGLIIGDKLL